MGTLKDRVQQVKDMAEANKINRREKEFNMRVNTARDNIKDLLNGERIEPCILTLLFIEKYNIPVIWIKGFVQIGKII